jgi:hypothetical protein
VFSACVRKFARRPHALARSFVAPLRTPSFFATNTANRRNGLEKQFQKQLAAHSESVGRTAGADQTRSRDCPVIGRGGQRHRLSLAALSLPLSTQKTENVWTPRSFIRAGWRVIVHTVTLQCSSARLARARLTRAIKRWNNGQWNRRNRLNLRRRFLGGMTVGGGFLGMSASRRLLLLEIKPEGLVESFSMPVGQYHTRHPSSHRAPDVRSRGSGYVESPQFASRQLSSRLQLGCHVWAFIGEAKEKR